MRRRSVATRWSPKLAEGGWVPVSEYFLDHYHELKPYHLTHGEAMFVIHLIRHKWDERAPYPAYGSLAKKMGVSAKTARRHAQSLEQKGYLRREARTAQPNMFYLEGLFGALEKHLESGSQTSAMACGRAPR